MIVRKVDRLREPLLFKIPDGESIRISEEMKNALLTVIILEKLKLALKGHNRAQSIIANKRAHSITARVPTSLINALIL